MATTLTVSNETESSMSRLTKDGRHLTYEVKVIQQPERARACGSGAKSSADRRPVDPPPVCELKVFEGEGDAKTDITFSHNANFFLFTTLENARPMHKGRVPVTPPTFPVLTGSPVAGMAYLDRPSPAGYFIFPDLSVRHEGMYRLAFSLYEELKEAKDGDVEPPEGSPETKDKLLTSNPMAPRAHVHFRLEVKSTPFAVYSAKKFPGLSESTPLSRTVAEQGCRVRIRRDVRMRRRDKASDGYQDFDEDNGAYPHSEHYGTPQQAPDRPRSISHGSMDSQAPYSTGRRPSFPEYNYFSPTNGQQANYQQPPPPAPAQSATSYGPHLNFGGSNNGSYTQFPLPQAVHQPPTPQYVQTNNGFQNVSNAHTRQLSGPPSYSYQQNQQQLPSYTNYLHPQSPSESPDYRQMSDPRRLSGGMTMNHQPPTLSMAPYVQNHPVLQHFSYNGQQQPGSRTTTPISTNGHAQPQLPPLTLKTDNLDQALGMDQKFEPKHEPKSPASAMQRPIAPSPSYSSNYNPFSYATPTSSNSISARTNSKRPFAEVFDSKHIQQPMFGGMRPDSAGQGKDREQIETDTGELEDPYAEDFSVKTLVYKRADGTQHAKKCPSPIENR
ncbi:hypothetical protein JMJ35_009208 [Cladonia borealis]|uniref:Velvet domain-containing protein n=1 Tax=Cladonia borealis TaxID=184061 RepID=A0AA39V225_9LECA|nr:hypothetical protein JMJ35_009208 [Cladonia borealis]